MVCESVKVNLLFPKQSYFCKNRSDQHPLDAAFRGEFDVIRQPLLAQYLIGHFNHNVISLQQTGLQVITIAAQALQSCRARCDNF